jgi:rhodanese-related sulfurtransferase
VLNVKKIVIGACFFSALVFILSVNGYMTPFQVLELNSSKHNCQQSNESRLISLKNAYQMYESNCAVFFDTRGTIDYKQSRISKSFHLTSAGLERNLGNILNLSNTGASFVLYSENFPSISCEEIYTTLKAKGVSRVYVLQEGFLGWENNKYPIIDGIIAHLTAYFGLRYAK